MTFNKGTLILVDYTAKVKDTSEVFETTIEEEAKKHSLHDPNIKYQPKLVSVGESWVIKGLDEALAKSKVGDKTTVEVTPDKGFGERDSGKVRMIPLRKLGEDAEKVSVGDTIEIDQKKGIVRYIGSGRVQVDYNHRFAGKTILYDVNVLKSLDTDEDKIKGILKRHIPVDDSKLSFKKSDKSLDVNIPEELFRADGLQIMKHFIQTDL
ncbi:MAG: peptidylprolyl isomerase, partial [Nitrosopumilaceae archaeon]|nr:peptidylprolyl isomerase [Nitrosopumilaceae archaeon]